MAPKFASFAPMGLPSKEWLDDQITPTEGVWKMVEGLDLGGGGGTGKKEHDDRSVHFREDGVDRRADLDRTKVVKFEIARILAERFGLNPDQIPARIFRKFDVTIVPTGDLESAERSGTRRKELRARIRSIKSISKEMLEVDLVITHKERRRA